MWPFRKNPPPRGLRFNFDGPHWFLSILSEEEIDSIGVVPSKAIAGRFLAGSDGALIGAVRVNDAFISFMHEVIRSAGPAVPELMATAAAQRDGWLYVIDLRTPDGPQGRVPPEDIIGAFEVRSGQISADSYQPFSDYRVYTQNGPPVLPSELRKALVEQLRVERE